MSPKQQSSTIAMEGLLDELLELTEQSLSYSRSEQWESLTDNEKTRQSKVVELEPLVQKTEAVSDDCRKKLTQLIELNESLTAICTQRRSQIAESISAFSMGKQAKRAYSD